MAIDWELVIGVVLTFSSTLFGVLLAFWFDERARQRRRMRDSFYAPFVELMDSTVRQLDAWKPVPLADLDHFERSATAMGLMSPEFRTELRSAEEQFLMYEEYRSHFGTHVEHMLTEELGPVSQAKHAMDTILEVTRGDVRTVREALLDPRSYEASDPSREWLSAFLAVALETKKVLSPGQRVSPGSAVHGFVVSWNDQAYVLEPVVESIAKRVFSRVREHGIRSMLAEGRRASRNMASHLLGKVREIARIPAR